MSAIQQMLAGDAVGNDTMETFQKALKNILNSTVIDSDGILLSVMKTCEEMVVARGCEDVSSTSLTSLAEHILDGTPVLVAGPKPSIRIFFHMEERVSVKSIRSIMENNNGYDRTIFVSIDGPTSFAKREAVATWGNTVQFFRYRQLVTNITKHHLVPPHRLCSDTARLQSDEKDHYPHILATDPVVQFYDFNVGDVVEITRHRGSTNSYKYYRVVVS